MIKKFPRIRKHSKSPLQFFNSPPNIHPMGQLFSGCLLLLLRRNVLPPNTALLPRDLIMLNTRKNYVSLYEQPSTSSTIKKEDERRTFLQLSFAFLSTLANCVCQKIISTTSIACPLPPSMPRGCCAKGEKKNFAQPFRFILMALEEHEKNIVFAQR